MIITQTAPKWERSGLFTIMRRREHEREAEFTTAATANHSDARSNTIAGIAFFVDVITSTFSAMLKHRSTQRWKKATRSVATESCATTAHATFF